MGKIWGKFEKMLGNVWITCEDKYVGKDNTTSWGQLGKRLGERLGQSPGTCLGPRTWFFSVPFSSSNKAVSSPRWSFGVSFRVSCLDSVSGFGVWVQGFGFWG